MKPRVPYFALWEWTCRDGTPYPQDWWYDRWIEVAGLCSRIRKAWGLPITVTSGYRTPAHNRKVGGARYSQHVQGRAADLVPSGGTALELHDIIWSMYKNDEIPELNGLGYYSKGFVHVDTGSRRRIWHKKPPS